MNLKNTFPRLKQIGSVVLFVAFSASLALAEEAQQGSDYLDVEAAAGYKFVSTDGNPGRAAEYTYLHSSPAVSLETKAGDENKHFHIDLSYLNEADYQGEVRFDYKGLLRLDLGAESLFHNLDHYPAEPPERPDALKTAAGVPWVKFSDNDPGDKYFVEVEQNRAGIRAKIPSYPAHVNLNYWRLERSGRKQLRFIEHGNAVAFASCNQCHVQSRSRTLDRVTEEVKGGIDAHIGPVDVIFEHLVREFRDKEPTPVDTFNPFSTRRLAGDWQHDEDPDSRLIATSIKLHTSLSGGVVGAAEFTIGKRENQSDLIDVSPVESETDFKKAAGDLTWIPSPKWTLNFRYRLLDTDNSNSSSVTSESLNPATSVNDPIGDTVTVRDNVDLTRGTYGAKVSYRPTRRLTMQGEYERKDIHRGNAGAALDEELDPVWEVPEDETINRYRVGFIARPLGGRRLKVNGWYQYLTSDDPAYAASAEESHTMFAGASYSADALADMLWGVTANLKLQQQDNDNHNVTQFAGATPIRYSLDRNIQEQNVTVGGWMNPTQTLMLGLNYGYLRTRILQDLLFGTSPSTTAGSTTDYTIEDDNVEYSQQVQTVSATVGWQILKNLKGHAEAYHIRSYAAWDPDFFRVLNFTTIGDPNVTASGLGDISKLDIRQNGLRVGLDWQMTPQWGTSFNYTFDDYEDRDTSYFDGTAQTYMVSLARTW